MSRVGIAAMICAAIGVCGAIVAIVGFGLGDDTVVALAAIATAVAATFAAAIALWLLRAVRSRVSGLDAAVASIRADADAAAAQLSEIDDRSSRIGVRLSSVAEQHKKANRRVLEIEQSHGQLSRRIDQQPKALQNSVQHLETRLTRVSDKIDRLSRSLWRDVEEIAVRVAHDAVLPVDEHGHQLGAHIEELKRTVERIDREYRDTRAIAALALPAGYVANAGAPLLRPIGASQDSIDVHALIFVLVDDAATANRLGRWFNAHSGVVAVDAWPYIDGPADLDERTLLSKQTSLRDVLGRLPAEHVLVDVAPHLVSDRGAELIDSFAADEFDVTVIALLDDPADVTRRAAASFAEGDDIPVSKLATDVVARQSAMNEQLLRHKHQGLATLRVAVSEVCDPARSAGILTALGIEPIEPLPTTALPATPALSTAAAQAAIALVDAKEP